MHFRTAELTDTNALVTLFKEAASPKGISFGPNEVSADSMNKWLPNAIANGLVIVAENPDDSTLLAGVVHASFCNSALHSHVMTELNWLVAPAFQEQKVDRSLLLILLDEVVNNHPQIGKVEAFLSESNMQGIELCQSLEFMIEGRLELRRKNPDKTYEADIALGWQNPAYEYDI